MRSGSRRRTQSTQRSFWRRLASACSACSVLYVVVCASLSAQQAAPLEAIPVRGHIYLIGGAVANVTVSAGPDGVLLVDSGSTQNADRVLAAIKALQARLQQALPAAPRAGADTTFTGGNVTGEIGGEGESAAILAHENVLSRLGEAKTPSKGLPTDTYFGANLKLAYFFNGEGVTLLRVPAAATDGDSVVHFRGTDVIATGELFDYTHFPFIDMAKGGSIQGVLAGLNRMVEMAQPEFRSEGGTLFISAYGGVGNT